MRPSTVLFYSSIHITFDTYTTIYLSTLGHDREIYILSIEFVSPISRSACDFDSLTSEKAAPHSQHRDDSLPIKTIARRLGRAVDRLRPCKKGGPRFNERREGR